MNSICGQGGICPVPIQIPPPCESHYLSGRSLPFECPKGGTVKQDAIVIENGRVFADPRVMANGACPIHKRDPGPPCPFWSPKRKKFISCSSCSNGPGANGN